MLGRRPGAVGAQHAATYRDRDDQEAQERPQTSTGSERVHSAQHDGKTSRDCSRRPSRVPSFRRFVSGSWEIRRRLRRARSGECQETLRGDRRPRPGRQSTNATRLAKPSSPSSAPFKEIKRRVERAFPRNSQEIPKLSTERPPQNVDALKRLRLPQNTLYVSKKSAVIALVDYKTSNLYGPQRFAFSEKVQNAPPLTTRPSTTGRLRCAPARPPVS